jgi:hypothetical protein
VKYIIDNKIGKIETKDHFFIGNAFEFYKCIYPQISKYPNTMKIDYEYDKYENGYYFDKR